MRDERGQAAIFAVLLLAIAAVVMGGLRTAQTELLARAVQYRAGEAAVEAATAVVADAYTEELRARIVDRTAPRDMRSVLQGPAIREAARAAASDMSTRNGGGAIEDVEVGCDRAAVRVTVTLPVRSHRASFEAPECSQP